LELVPIFLAFFKHFHDPLQQLILKEHTSVYTMSNFLSNF
jgi:hypothetical protein